MTEPAWKRNGRNGPLDWWLGCQTHGDQWNEHCMSCGIAHDRCDGDSEFAAGVSAACRNHLELVNAAVAYGVTVGAPSVPPSETT